LTGIAFDLVDNLIRCWLLTGIAFDLVNYPINKGISHDLESKERRMRKGGTPRQLEDDCAVGDSLVISWWKGGGELVNFR
jgi:hypothetical protein